MDMRVQIHGISPTEYASLFASTQMPSLGNEYQAEKDLTLVNLSSDAPNFIDAETFQFIAQFAGQILLDVAIGLLTSYIYDKLKKDDVKITINDNRIIVVKEPADQIEQPSQKEVEE